MNLPITQKLIDVVKLQPIISYLINSINKIGKDLHSIELIEVKNPIQYSTDFQSLISFRTICKYTIKVNDSYNLKNTDPSYKKPNIKHDLVILFELISQKNSNEDSFFKADQINSDKIYIKKINIIDIDSGQYLPGNNLDNFNSFFKYSYNLTNKIVDNKYLETKKNINQNEVNNLTKNIKNNDNNDITIESFFK